MGTPAQIRARWRAKSNMIAGGLVIAVFVGAAALAAACEPYTPPPPSPRAMQPAKCGYHPICLKGNFVCTIDANGCDLCTCNLPPGQ